MDDSVDNRIAVAIFAGGASRRMGRDKAQLTIEGVPLLERTARVALEVPARVLVVGREAPSDWPLLQVGFVPDDTPGLGPLGGLQTVLQREAEVLALACDLPRLTADGLRWLLSQRTATPSPHGLVVDNEGQLEPLFAIYTQACLPLINANLAALRRSLHALIAVGDFAFVPAPPEIAAQLINVNTPEDLAAL